MPEFYRHTKIIATLGPATETREMLQELIENEVDILRLNMAHVTHQEVRDTMQAIREISAEVGRPVAVMMDVKGAEIRTGKIERPICLGVGDWLELHIEGAEPTGDIPSVSVNYIGLPEDLAVGNHVIVDRGVIRLRVVEKEATRVRLEVLTAGELGLRRRINMPGVRINLPILTEKDEADLRVGVECGIDFVALSFARQAEDIETLRDLLHELGSEALIIAKIEDQVGVDNVESIVKAADGVMVARGDLSTEIDYFRHPLVQTELVHACQAEGKPVIIATYLLESMISSPLPTRAEISDISNAIRERVDALMLSRATTIGEHPIESVRVLKRIIRSIEPSIKKGLNKRILINGPKTLMLRSAAALACQLERDGKNRSGIVVFTRSGYLGYVLGALRPYGIPIFAFTDVEMVYRQLLLAWGVEPFLTEFAEDPEETILSALAHLKAGDWVAPGEWMAVITNALTNDRVIDTLQLRQVED